MSNEILKKLESIESLLKQQQDKTLTFAEAAKYLNLSRSYLYKLTHKMQIPHYKPHGKRIYFSKNELDAWIKQNPVRTISEIDQEAEDYINDREMKGGA